MRLGACLLGAMLLAVGMSPAADAARYVVEIKDMSFGPAPAHLQVGDIIEWKNSDIFRHTATERGGQFDIMLAPGATSEVVLKKAGTFPIFCRYHPSMTMRLKVRAAP